MAFKKGESWNGNKNGRPKNTGHRQKLFAEMVLPHKEKIVETAINLALSGNDKILSFMLERLLPAKPTDEPVNLGKMFTSFPNSSQLMAYILDSLTTGKLTPSEGQKIAKLIESSQKLISYDELAAKIADMQEMIKKHVDGDNTNGIG